MSEINKLKKQADKIYAKMENMQRLSDSELKAKTDEFKMRLANGETLEQILPDAYAAWRRRLSWTSRAAQPSSAPRPSPWRLRI